MTMKVHDGLEGLRSLAPGQIISIGNFDGVHLGHRHILRRAVQLRDQHDGARVAVVTFEPHPLTVLRPRLAPPRLTPPALKRELLRDAGVDDYVVLPPTPEVLGLEAEHFWTILRDDVQPLALVEGNSFFFGKGRRGTIDRLRAWTAEADIDLHVVESVTVPLLDLQVVPVSSSLIRWLIAYGRVRDAAICLGRPYTLEGEVTHGNHRGRTIGVPTANVNCDELLVPADGVYAGRSTIDNVTYPTAISIGTTPTFGDHARQVEAHLAGFSGDIYGRIIRLELLDWVRDQWKFTSLEALKEQMFRDLRHVDAIAK
jgi:riboflavin kinase / FMN adenylyltransferase